MSAIVDKERRIRDLEEALTESCDYVETAADIIEDLDGDDDDDQCKQVRRKVRAWRRLLEKA